MEGLERRASRISSLLLEIENETALTGDPDNKKSVPRPMKESAGRRFILTEEIPLTGT